MENNGVITLAEATKLVGDRRRAFQSLKCLVKRGIMKKIARGVYQLAINMTLSLNDKITTLSSNNDALTPPPRGLGSVHDPGSSSGSSSVGDAGSSGCVRRVRVGVLEYSVLSFLAERGLRRFLLCELSRGLGRDRRIIHRAVQGLVRKGIVRRVARGLYEVVVRLEDLSFDFAGRGAKSRAVDRGFRLFRLVDRPLVLFDNVRGYTLSWRYVGGDRRVRLSFVDMVNMRDVRYAEVGVLLPTEDSFRGSLVIYNNRSFVSDLDGEVKFKRGVVIEWRPPAGYYDGRGLVDAKEEFGVVLFEAFVVIARAIAGLYGRGSAVRALRRLMGGAGFAGLCREVLHLCT